jgi:hypothetical protein
MDYKRLFLESGGRTLVKVSGRTESDAKQYQERAVKRAIKESKA